MRPRLSALAQLVKLLIKVNGPMTTAQLVEETGYSSRMIFRAKVELKSASPPDAGDVTPVSETDTRGMTPKSQGDTDGMTPMSATDADVTSPPDTRVSPSRAYKELPSEVVLSERESHTPTVEQDAARDDEEACGCGVFASPRQVRYSGEDVISLVAIEMRLGLSSSGRATEQDKTDARRHAIASAIQWSSEIAAGKPKREVVPTNPIGAIVAAITNERRRADQAKAQARPRNSNVFGLPDYMVRRG